MRHSMPQAISITLNALLAEWGGSPARGKLARLWADWPRAMGPELAQLARPAGASKRLLLLACDNAAQMQELSFLAEEYRQRANEYLQSEYFEGCRPVLARAKKREARMAAPGCKKRKARQKRPSGKYLAGMDANSPVARCYALFAGKKIGKNGLRNTSK